MRSAGASAGSLPLRVTIDACALIPSLLARDNLFQAIVRSGQLVPVACPEILEEAARTMEEMLAKRSFLTEPERWTAWGVLARVWQLAVHVPSPPAGYTVPELGEHQKDAHLLWTCEQGHARAVITIEPRLWHGLGVWRGIPILKPTDALKQLGLAQP